MELGKGKEIEQSCLLTQVIQIRLFNVKVDLFAQGVEHVVFKKNI